MIEKGKSRRQQPPEVKYDRNAGVASKTALTQSLGSALATERAC